MSTSFEKIFTESTILKAYTISLNDKEILNEDVLSFELRFDYNSPFIEGSLVLKDSVGFADTDIFDGTTKIKVYANDVYDEKFLREFRITNVANDEYDERFKKYNLTIVDELYYTLMNTYLSKGFTGNPVDAFKAYMTELKMDTYLSDNKMEGTYDAFEGDDYSFIVPQDRSVLEFFLFELGNYGYRVWQDRKAFNVRKFDIADLEYIENEDADGNLVKTKFTNDTDNSAYGFKIHDFKLKYNPVLQTNIEAPISENHAYDPLTKSILTDTNNLTDVYATMKLNTKDLSTLQHTTGKKFTTDAETYLDKQKLNLENVFSNNNTLEIVVPGNYKYNKVGMLADIQLKGNAMQPTSTLEGDTFHSGTYLVTKISDRYVGNKLIQKMTLNRIDFQTPRNK